MMAYVLFSYTDKACLAIDLLILNRSMVTSLLMFLYMKNYWVTQKLLQIYTAKSRNHPNMDTQNYSTDLQ